MATTHYKQRSTDMLDLLDVTDVFLTKLKDQSKRAVAHSVTNQVENLKATKIKLERKLIELTTAPCSLLGWFKKSAAIKALKKALREVNLKLVDWIKSISQFLKQQQR